MAKDKFPAWAQFLKDNIKAMPERTISHLAHLQSGLLHLTDFNVLYRCPISKLTENTAHAEGKCLGVEALKLLAKHPKVNFNAENIEFYSNNGFVEAVLYYAAMKNPVIKKTVSGAEYHVYSLYNELTGAVIEGEMPVTDMSCIIPKDLKVTSKHIGFGINPYKLAKLTTCFFGVNNAFECNGSVKVLFTGGKDVDFPNRAMAVFDPTNTENDIENSEFGLIMPFMVNY